MTTPATTPATRPLTFADRVPEPGDTGKPNYKGAPVGVRVVKWLFPDMDGMSIRFENKESKRQFGSIKMKDRYRWQYLSRADNGPITHPLPDSAGLGGGGKEQEGKQEE